MLRSGLYNFIGTSLQMAVSIVTVPLLIRTIGLQEYGLWVLVSATIGMAMLAQAGLAVSTIVFVSRDLADNNIAGISQTLTVAIGGILILASCAALALWSGAGRLVGFFSSLTGEQQVVAAHALRIGALAVWAQLLQQIFVGIQQGFQKYGYLNFINTTQSILASMGCVVLAMLGGRVLMFVQWQAGVSLATLVAHIGVSYLLLRGMKLSPVWNAGRAWTMVRYSIFTWGIALSGVLFGQMDRLIVGSVLGTASLGTYAAITTITTKINSLSAVPVQPLLPALSRIVSQQGNTAPLLVKQLRQSLQLNASIALGIGAILLMFPSVVMHIMLGSAATEIAILAFVLAVVIYSLYSLNATGYFSLLGIGAVHICLMIQIASTIASLALIYLGANTFGLLGAILGNAGFTATLVFMVSAARRLGIQGRIWLSWLLPPLTWFSVMVVLSLVLPSQGFIRILASVGASIPLVVWLKVALDLHISSLVHGLWQPLVRGFGMGLRGH